MPPNVAGINGIVFIFIMIVVVINVNVISGLNLMMKKIRYWANLINQKQTMIMVLLIFLF